jgi:hypothetical protein
MRTRAVILSGLILVLGVQTASAQAWDSPAFMAPQQPGNVGLYLVDPHGGDVGVVGLWRRAGATTTLGLRAGIFNFDDVGVAVGADASRMLIRAGQDLPVDVAGTLGIGATFANTTVARIPVGLSVGRRIAAQNWAFVPYVHPRVALDILTGDDSDTELSVTTDLGADFQMGDNLLLRLGIALGDHRSVGFGVALTGIPLTVAAR